MVWQSEGRRRQPLERTRTLTNVEAQQQAEPASFAPKQREITCMHEAGHAVVGVYCSARLQARVLILTVAALCGATQSHRTASLNTSQAARKVFAHTEDMLASVGPVPIPVVNQNLAMWRSNAIFSLAGPEAERLSFGLIVSPPSGDLLVAKSHCRRASVSRAGANLLLDHCKAEARVLLQRYWAAVEAIAKALDRDDELDGEAVARLIAQNPPLR